MVAEAGRMARGKGEARVRRAGYGKRSTTATGLPAASGARPSSPPPMSADEEVSPRSAPWGPGNGRKEALRQAMRSGRGGRSWWVGLLLVVTAGCAGSREQLEKALVATPAPSRTALEAAQLYLVRPSDTLSVRVSGRPGWSGEYTVPPEGRLSLGGEVAVRIDGLTPSQVAQGVGEAAGLRAEQVSVQVTG